MKIKFLVEEDFVNYKKPSMFVGFPKCTWKCEQECGKKGICQNGALANAPTFDISYEEIINRYISNPISKAIVFGGLEPMDSWDDVYTLIQKFRKQTQDDIIIYTGYRLDELTDEIAAIRTFFKNVYLKCGRFIPDQKPHFDKVLGVNLASDNQYGVKIS